MISPKLRKFYLTVSKFLTKWVELDTTSVWIRDFRITFDVGQVVTFQAPVGKESQHRVGQQIELYDSLTPYPDVVNVGLDAGTRLRLVLNGTLLNSPVAV